MDECIDYTKETKRYLRDYGRIKATIRNLEEEIKLRSKLLQSEFIPVARYGGEVGGSAGGMTAVEVAACQHDKEEQRLEQLRREKAGYELIIRKIDRALEGLGATDAAIIQGHFMERYTWQEVGQRCGYSDRWARGKGKRALQAVSFMMFGRG